MESDAKKRTTRRRGQGEGSIFQRGDGRWVARIAAGYDQNGKRLRKTVYGLTKKEVQDKLLELHQRKKTGQLPATSKVTVAEFLKQWLEDVARVKVEESTYIRYEQLIRIHINSRIGGIKLERLTTSDADNIYSEMERANLSTRMRRFVHTLLSEALDQAIKWGLVVRNVCDTATPPMLVQDEMICLDAIQAARLLKASKKDRLHAMYVVAVTTGMRQGELLALKWGDIDLIAKKLTVKRTITAKQKIKKPKSKKSLRTIDLSEMVVDALEKHRKLCLATGLAGSEWVFPDTNGGLLRRQNFVRRSFKPLVKASGVPDIRFHDLRHAAATLMLGAGINPKIVSETLGHASVAFTLDTYGHVMPGMGREAADKMGSLFAVKAS
jgi:integrase